MRTSIAARDYTFAGDNVIMPPAAQRASVSLPAARAVREARQTSDLADKPVVTRKAFRVVVDPVTASHLRGRKEDAALVRRAAPALEATAGSRVRRSTSG